MATERRRVAILAGLVVVLSVVLYRTWTATSMSTSSASSSPRHARAAVRPLAPVPVSAQSSSQVHLGALNEERSKPASADRNLFRFKAKPAPRAPVRLPAVSPPAVAVPAGPPPPPPIPLKFIGIVEGAQAARRIAALVDPAGRPYHGGEGDVIAGQYRVLKIGVESVEMAYLDGRGRQTIRLSGS